MINASNLNSKTNNLIPHIEKLIINAHRNKEKELTYFCPKDLLNSTIDILEEHNYSVEILPYNNFEYQDIRVRW